MYLQGKTSLLDLCFASTFDLRCLLYCLNVHSRTRIERKYLPDLDEWTELLIGMITVRTLRLPPVLAQQNTVCEGGQIR